MIFLKLLGESFNFAFTALRQNKLRTFLSLLGITIGIMIVIAVFSAVDTLRSHIQSSVERLGSNTVYIQKWPWEFSSDFPWWKYMNRPDPSLRDYEKLVDRVEGADGVAFEIGIGDRTIKYKSNSVEGAQLAGATHDYEKTRIFDIPIGRYFTDSESRAGSAVAIIGSDIAEGLFPNINPDGKTISILGRKVTVVGVFAKEGEDMLGVSNDKTILLPVNFLRNVIDVEDERYQPNITVKGKENISVEELESELRGVMRSIHRLGPREPDDFALNKSTILTARLDVLFRTLNISGLIIGLFSILVGGFGIANIMFVSVNERTNIIGIQKSLGAKNYFILLQFLIESVILCLMGGLLGLGMVYLIALLISSLADFAIEVSFSKVVITFVISTIIGLVSGIIPAVVAARKDPVEAIRSK